MAPPDHKCTEKENIAEIRVALKDLVAEFRTEFRGVMQELKTALEDGREYRTRLQAHDDAIRHQEAVNQAQWEKIDGLGKQMANIDKWIAAHGDIKEKENKLNDVVDWVAQQKGANGDKQKREEKIDEVVQWVERQKGARAVLLYIPTVVTVIVGILVIGDHFIK